MKSENPSDGEIEFLVFGTFACRGPGGTDLTPKSSKAQALLAMLVTEKSNRRTRTWLQDRLWSRSTPERGAASLRQTLRQIRQAMGPWSSIFGSDRKAIWLNAARIKSDWPSKVHCAEFLEGLDVDDPEFDEWLRTVRGDTSSTSRTAARPNNPSDLELSGRWQISLSEPSFESKVGLILESSFHALLTKSLLELEMADVCSASDQASGRETISVQATAQTLDATKVGFRILVTRPHTKRILHSNLRFIGAASTPVDANRELIPLIHTIQSAIREEIAAHTRSSATSDRLYPSMANLSRRVFSFSNDVLRSVDDRMRDFSDGPETAAALGWRTQVAVIRDIEGLAEDYRANAEQGLELAKLALETNAMNSIVLSAAANAHIFLNWDTTTGGELSELAVRANPANPLSWWSYANSALYLDKPAKALRAAQFASKLADKSPVRFWCDFQLGLAAMQRGDLELARRSWESSAALSPSFRPPRRYLLALYSHLGEAHRAQRVVAELKSLEENFSIERLVLDETYPISLARSFGLLNLDRFKAVDLL